MASKLLRQLLAFNQKFAMPKALLRLRTIIATLLLLSAGGVSAEFATEADARDYFAPREPYLQARLNTNERHHLGLGMHRLKESTKLPHETMRAYALVQAKNEFDFILNFWPNHPRVLALQSETLIRMRRPELMEQYFDRAYQFNTEAAPVYIVHGISLLDRGDTRGAIEKLNRGLALDPASVNGHYNLGLAYLRLKDYARANEHAQRAYALGHPLPGLRDQLRKAGAWNPLPEKTAEPPSQGTSQQGADAPQGGKSVESANPTTTR